MALDTKVRRLVYEAVGGIVLRYADIETYITHITAVVFEHAGGKRKAWKKFPRHMGPRKQFLDDSFRDLSQLAAYLPKWRSLQKRMERPEEIRHAVVHGAWNQELEAPGLAIVFHRIAPRGEARIEMITTSLHEMVDLNFKLEKLARETAKFSDRIDKDFVPKEHREHTVRTSG